MQIVKRWMVWALLGAAALLTGCSSLRHGGSPDPAYSVEADMTALRASLSTTASVTSYYAGTPTMARRNAFVDARVAMANLAYIQFISDLTADKQQIDTASEMLVLGLNLLGTTALGARAKTNLAAMAAGVSGSRAVVDKNYFYEKTTSALVATMNAQRKEVLLQILEGVKKPLEDYSFTQAVADTHAYYAAGTLNAAVAAVHASASAREARADQALTSLGEAPALTDAQIDDRAAVTNAVLAAIKSGDLAQNQKLLKLLGLEGLPQGTVEQARASLGDNFRRALRARPELAKEIRSKL
ncbi:MAG: hypothetical protein AB7I35_05480 [Ramlibacter sp.]